VDRLVSKTISKPIAEGANIRRKMSRHHRSDSDWFYQLRSDQSLRARANEINWLTYLLALVLVLYLIFVRSRMG
jgi:hypothetical protein